MHDEQRCGYPFLGSLRGFCDKDGYKMRKTVEGAKLMFVVVSVDTSQILTFLDVWAGRD